MRKLPILLLFLVVVLFFLLNISHPFSSHAQGCGGILGSNVATNWYRTNLEFIRENSGCSGPIPIEVIITPAERDNPALLLELQDNLRELNFVPTWRPWGNGMPQGSELGAWINAASILTIGQFQLFNEPNNCLYGCFSGATPNPAADAQAALAFLEASQRGEIKIPLALMPLSPRTPDGGNFLSEQRYWTDFNNACGGCVKNFDYIGLNIYPQTTPGTDPNENVNKFINDFNAQVNFFAGLGVNLGTARFIIAEAGLDPGSYGTNLGADFQARVQDTLAFAQALEARIASDPTLFINLDQITFFLSDAAGNQVLIFRLCDASGCRWVVMDFLILNPNVPPGPQALICNPSNPGDPDSRPVRCDACNQTDLLTSSCATTFTINDKVHYLWGDVDFWCPVENPKPWLKKTWTGTITVNPSDTTIPFVGKKGQENEQRYLADYFEGTGFYYKPPYDFSNPADVSRVLAEGGVFRKLAPKSIQDDLKRQMVWRAINTQAGILKEGGIHDYSVSYGGESAQLSEFAGHFPPYESEENYQEKYEAWKNSDGGRWFRLWAAVPMFSREDTPGKIIPYLGNRPEDKFVVQNPAAQVEKVPHVARLYEVTGMIQKLLMSEGFLEPTQAQKEAETTIASTEENVLGEQVLRAQTGEPSFSASGYCTRTDGSYTVNLTVNFVLPPQHHGRDLLVEIKSPTYWMNQCPNEKVCSNLVVTPFTVPGQPGGGINVSYHAKADGVTAPGSPEGFTIELNNSFAVVFTEDGCIVAGGPVPEPPTCGLRPPIPVDSCSKSAITDSNPNDDLCCSPINISLSATDTFINPHFDECRQNPLNCVKVGTYDVSRQVGVSLVHPYLTEIWNQTTDVWTGFFNILRSYKLPEFADLDAASTVSYSYTPGSASPTSGQFYFPHLGGIQEAKKWVLQTLNPAGIGGKPPGPAAPPAPGPTTLDYTIDFRNSAVNISWETKENVIRQVKNSWPNSKIESDWDLVYNSAVANGWNPAFVIALWVEESGASGVDAYDLGCTSAPKNSLLLQLNCLFNRPYRDESFEEFMCMYSEGPEAPRNPCVFETNPHFPGGVKTWYDRLTQ